MASASVLRLPDYNLPFILQTDASDKGVGAVLSQIEHEKDHPIYFFSKKLLVRERKFSTTEKELLAIVMACKKFYPYLVGSRFTVQSDHRALQYILQKEPTTARMSRWLESLQDLDFEIKYKPGRLNGNADALSRQAWTTASNEKEEKEGVKADQLK